MLIRTWWEDHASVTTHLQNTEINLDLSWKLPFCWLPLMVSEGAKQATGGENIQQVYSAVNPASYSSDLPRVMQWLSDLRPNPQKGTHSGTVNLLKNPWLGKVIGLSIVLLNGEVVKLPSNCQSLYPQIGAVLNFVREASHWCWKQLMKRFKTSQHAKNAWQCSTLNRTST